MKKVTSLMDTPYLFVDGEYITYNAIKLYHLRWFSAPMNNNAPTRQFMFPASMKSLELEQLLTIPVYKSTINQSRTYLMPYIGPCFENVDRKLVCKFDVMESLFPLFWFYLYIYFLMLSLDLYIYIYIYVFCMSWLISLSQIVFHF